MVLGTNKAPQLKLFGFPFPHISAPKGTSTNQLSHLGTRIFLLHIVKTCVFPRTTSGNHHPGPDSRLCFPSAQQLLLIDPTVRDKMGQEWVLRQSDISLDLSLAFVAHRKNLSLHEDHNWRRTTHFSCFNPNVQTLYFHLQQQQPSYNGAAVNWFHVINYGVKLILRQLELSVDHSLTFVPERKNSRFCSISQALKPRIYSFLRCSQYADPLIFTCSSNNIDHYLNCCC